MLMAAINSRFNVVGNLKKRIIYSNLVLRDYLFLLIIMDKYQESYHRTLKLFSKEAKQNGLFDAVLAVLNAYVKRTNGHHLAFVKLPGAIVAYHLQIACAV